MIINDIQGRDDLILVTDSQDVQAIKEHVPAANDEDFDSFFAKVEDGDYVELYGFYGVVPRLTKPLFKIEL